MRVLYTHLTSVVVRLNFECGFKVGGDQLTGHFICLGQEGYTERDHERPRLNLPGLSSICSARLITGLVIRPRIQSQSSRYLHLPATRHESLYAIRQ